MYKNKKNEESIHRTARSGETLFCRSSSAFEIAVRLNEDLAVAEHVGKLCDLFAVLDRGFKWFRKVLGYQEGKVRVVCLELLGFAECALQAVSAT